MLVRQLLGLTRVWYCCFMVLFSYSLWAARIELPSGLIVDTECGVDINQPQEKYQLSVTGETTNPKLSLFVEDDGYLMTESYKHCNRSGIGFISFESSAGTVSGLSPRYKGTLEVVLVREGSGTLPDLSKLSLSDELNSKVIQDNTATLENHLSFRQRQENQYLIRLVCTNVQRNKFKFRELQILGGDEGVVCVPGRVDLKRKTGCFSAIVIRFKPDHFAYKTEFFIHVADQKKVAEVEDALTEMHELTNDTSSAIARLSERALPLRNKTLDGELRKKGTNWISRFIQGLGAHYYFGYDVDNLFPSFDYIPEEGVPAAKLISVAKLLASEENKEWSTGQVSGSLYSGSIKHYEQLGEAFIPFAHTNLIQRSLNASGAYFEGQIVNMLLNMLNAPNMPVGEPATEDDADDSSTSGDTDSDKDFSRPSGLLTPGGTESIKAALLAYGNIAHQSGNIKPEIIVPTSVHPAFKKGAEACGMNVIYADIEEESEGDNTPASFKVKLTDVENKITDRTVLLVGSAFNYPHGVMDDIKGLGKLAAKHNLFLHVDGCLGGFPLHWLQVLGEEDKSITKVPPFDFSVPEVTSISVDTHKYGYSLKGSSVVLFRTTSLKNMVTFVDANWSGGFYLTTNLQGSTCVGNYAAAWMALLKTGKAEYMRQARELHRVTCGFAEIINSYPELEVIGTPYTQVCFKTKKGTDFSIFHVNDSLDEDKWKLTVCQNPPVLRFCVTGPQVAQSDILARFRESMDKAIEYAKSHKGEKPISASFYGLAKYGINLRHVANREAFAKVAIDLMQASSNQADEDVVADFKIHWQQELHRILGVHELNDPFCGTKKANPFSPFMGRTLKAE